MHKNYFIYVSTSNTFKIYPKIILLKLSVLSLFLNFWLYVVYFIIIFCFTGTMSSATIGIGAIILIGLWSSSFILCLLSLRTRHIIGPIVFVFTILTTIILLSIPRSPIDIPKPENKVCYSYFIQVYYLPKCL